MTTPSPTISAVRMPRGTAVSAQSRPVAVSGTGHLTAPLASLTAFALAALGAAAVTVMMRVAL